jgi:uncharacterized membrane protein YkvA (DUF1232 family)
LIKEGLKGDIIMDINEELKNQKYADAYSEEKLFDKIIRFAKILGIRLIYVALLLYYVLQKAEVPVKSKLIIYGALGYFILPFDLVPDSIPGIGHIDDMAVLLSAIASVAFYIDQDVKNKAKSKLNDWFGAYNEDELTEIDSKIKKESTIK